MDRLSSERYLIIDQFLPNEVYAGVRSFFLQHLPDFSPAGIGALNQNLVHAEVRGDHTFWLDRTRDVELEGFWSLVDETLHHLNRYGFLGLNGYEFHLANYPPGTHYAKHLDQFKGRNNRTVSMVMYLNEGWKPGDGGELEIYLPDNTSVIVEPRQQRCVVFMSAEMPHRVRESQINRYSLTGWLLRQPAALGQFLG